MKKRLFVFLLMVTVFTVGATAQVKFGLKGGLNVTSMSLNSDVFNGSNRAGFYIGPTVKFTLPVIGLGVDVSALYDERSAKLENNEGSDNTLKQKQIAVPVNLRYGFGLGQLASLYFFAGPQFGFNVGSDVESVDWKWKNSNFSVNVGAGVMLVNHLQVNANYNIACGKTGKSASSIIDDYNAKLNSWQIGLAYYF